MSGRRECVRAVERLLLPAVSMVLLLVGRARAQQAQNSLYELSASSATAAHYRRHLSQIMAGTSLNTSLGVSAIASNAIVRPTNLAAAAVPGTFAASVKVTCAGPSACPPLNFVEAAPGSLIGVYDQSGLPVAAAIADAKGRAAWAEMDAAGNPVPAGTYYVSAPTPKAGQPRWTRVALIR